GVQRQGVRCLVAHDEARRDAVRVSRACGGGRDGKDAVEDQRAILVEVVVTQTGGEVESISGGQGCFAEGGGLLQIVVQVGKEQLVHPGPLCSLGPAGGDRARRITRRQLCRRGRVEPLH